MNGTWIGSALAAAMLLSLAGCGVAEPVCVPGATQACLCSGARPGAQVCAADGARWNFCECEGGTDGEEDAAPKGVAFDASLTGEGTRGAELYGARCATCHGADARGTSTGPDLAEDVAGERNEALWEVIQEGDDEMPAVALTAQGTADVIAYLRTLFGPEPSDE